MNRRDFLTAASYAGAASMIPYARLAHAVGPFSDYKALVCLFMYGGNDSHNTIIPLGAEYDAYAKGRTSLAMANNISGADNPADSIFKRPLNAITPSNMPGRSFAMHTSLKKTSALFNAGKAAVISNVGPMTQPTSKVQFLNGGIALPPQLFSHSDQQSYWQSLTGDLGVSGWGGRMADLMEAAAVNGNSPLSIGISLAGGAPWLRAQTAVPYSVSPDGPQKIEAYRWWDAWDSNPPRPNPQQVFLDRIVVNRRNAYEDVYGDVVARSMSTEAFVSGKLEVIPTFRSDFPGTAADTPGFDPTKPGLADRNGNVANGLADQLRMVARMIAARGTLADANGVTPKRQVFFVSIGGFDNHGAEYEKHARLLAAIDSGVAAFQAKMEALGVSQNVTLFTASEFGRTLGSNGEGSDHGWGGHHMVVGGAVQGGKFYGAPNNNFPIVALNTGTDVGEGRLLPTIATDEYAATLGRWFGLSKPELETVLPNLRNFQQFPNYNVGFLG
jgi:uncharacterized protein (DUF1501 family)